MGDNMRNELPSLKMAQKRTNDQTKINHSFEIEDRFKTLGKHQTYAIRTYGCQANERDTETLQGILEAIGYTKAEELMSADLILLNTCAIRENAEQKVFGQIGALKNLKLEKPNLIFGICGCMAQEESVVKEIMEKYHHVDLVFGTHNIHRLPQLVHEAMMSKAQIFEVWSQEGEVIENMPAKRESAIKGSVNITYGCDKFCTYCIVPYTRGKERSRTVEDIVQEVVELKENGYQEVTLLGQNVNAYGKDFESGIDFAYLLKQVANTQIPRIRFMTSHPWDFTDEMVDVLSEYDNLMPAIHLPVQSGNSDILKLMGRRYTRANYIELFDKITAKLPNASFSTDIIVGFPNETQEQFEDTLSLFEHCKFDNAYTFIYSPRKGTPAAKMDDNVPYEDKQQRLYALNDVAKKYALAKNDAYIGRVVKVLVEGFSKKDDTVLSGYTDTHKLVNFKGDASLIGSIIEVTIIGAKTWYLMGEIN